MRYFLRDQRIYVGPVNDTEISQLMTQPLLANSGFACSASPERIDTFLTLPVSRENLTELSKLRMQVG